MGDYMNRNRLRWAALFAVFASVVAVLSIPVTRKARAPKDTYKPGRTVWFRPTATQRAEYARNNCVTGKSGRTLTLPEGQLPMIEQSDGQYDVDPAWAPWQPCGRAHAKVGPRQPSNIRTLFPTTGPTLYSGSDLLLATTPTSPATGSDIYYIDPAGSDTNPGTSGSPKRHFYAFYTENASMGCSGITGSLLIPRGSVIRVKTGTYSGDLYYPLLHCNLSGVTIEPDSGATIIFDGGGTWAADSYGRPTCSAGSSTICDSSTAGGQGDLAVLTSSGLDAFTFKGRGPASATVTVQHYNETYSGQGSVASIFGRDPSVYTTDQAVTDIRFLGLIIKENGGLPGSPTDYWGDDHNFYLNGGYCTNSLTTYATSTQPANITIAFNQFLSVTGAHIQSYTGPRPCQAHAVDIIGNYFVGGQAGIITSWSPIGPRNWRILNNTFLDGGNNIQPPYDGSMGGTDRRTNLYSAVAFTSYYNAANGCPTVCTAIDSTSLFENNLMIQAQSAAQFDVSYYKNMLWETTSAPTSGHNLFYSRRPTPVLIRSYNNAIAANTDYTSLTAYRTAFPGRETSSINADPLLTDTVWTGGLDLSTTTGSPARDAGVDVTTYFTSTLDMNGNAVIVDTTPDIGAWQSAGTVGATTTTTTTTTTTIATTTTAPGTPPAGNNCFNVEAESGTLSGSATLTTDAGASGGVSNNQVGTVAGSSNGSGVTITATAAFTATWTGYAKYSSSAGATRSLLPPYHSVVFAPAASLTWSSIGDFTLTSGANAVTFRFDDGTVVGSTPSAGGMAIDLFRFCADTPVTTTTTTTTLVATTTSTSTSTTTSTTTPPSVCVPVGRYTATATVTTGTATYLWDANQSTLWTATTPATATLNFGQVRTVTTVYIEWVSGRAAKRFRILTRTSTAAPWTVRTVVSTYSTATSATCWSATIGASARYVRLEVNSAETAATGRPVQVREFGAV